jgi:alkanesulfonate monooxygenase SsuD/methylene tetrahydromethanopterin reductase-like flavin-dependent oxidoreductase (luciferase family)
MANQRVKFTIGGSLGMTWEQVLNVVTTAEELGFEGYHPSDHFTPNQPFALNGDMLEACTLLAAAAGHTTKLRLGAIVSPIMFRHPVLVAKAVTTLDHVSGGRAMLGMGIGNYDREYEAFGVPYPSFRERAEHLEETLQITKALFSQERTTMQTKHYHLQDAPFDPKPVQQPHLPILLAGGSKRVMRLAAQYADDWNCFGIIDDLTRKRHEIDEVCKEIGRDPSTLTASRQIMLVLSDDPAVIGEAVERVSDRLAANPAHAALMEQRGKAAMARDFALIGGVEEVKDSIGRWVEAGVTHFNINWPRPANRPMLERFMAEVAPAFK